MSKWWWLIAGGALVVLLTGAYFVTGWLTAATIARELVLGQSRYAVEDLNGQPVPAARDLYAGLGKPAPGDVDLRVVNFEVDGPILIMNFRVTNAHAPAVLAAPYRAKIFRSLRLVTIIR